MNLLVFSDSHGSTAFMTEVCRSTPHNIVLHCGDFSRDAAALPSSANVLAVTGNCDGPDSNEPKERFLEYEGVKIWMLHGHTEHVKLSLMPLAAKARRRGIQLVLFGHTHNQTMLEKSGVTLCNPGSASSGKYATIVCREGGFKCQLNG